MISLYYHPYTWKIRPHHGINGNAYFQDIDIKPKWIVERRLDQIKLIKAKPLTWDDYRQTHSPDYVNRINKGDKAEISKYSWITWSKSFIRAQLYTGGCIYESGLKAISSGISGALVLEGHHGLVEKGAGFCTFNHLAVAINKTFQNTKLKRIAIVDLDRHQGDGTIELFRNDPRIRILDIYNTLHHKGEFRISKNARSIMFDNSHGYIERLEQQINKYIIPWQPELVFYVAGVDIFEKDRYGGVPGVDMELVSRRDQVIFENLRKSNIPVSFSLGGGYVSYVDPNGKQRTQEEVDKRRSCLVDLHVNTIKAAIRTEKHSIDRHLLN